MPEVRRDVNGKVEGALLGLPQTILIFPILRTREGFVPADD